MMRPNRHCRCAVAKPQRRYGKPFERPPVLTFLLRKAPGSPLYLWILNRFLRIIIPFNAPHRIAIERLGADGVGVTLPLCRRNRNHLGSVHACALATASEFATGVLVLSRLDPAVYRMIMKSIQVEYHYQGKTDVVVECGMNPEWIESTILAPLQGSDSATAAIEARAFDSKRNLLSTAKVVWHFKRWDAVRTGS